MSDQQYPHGVYQQQQQQQPIYVQEVMPANQVVYTNSQPQQIIYTNPQPQVVVQQQPQPQPQVVIMQQPPQQAQSQPVIINNVTNADTTVNHGCHAVLFCCTGGLWLPVWVIACLGLGCERPCG